METYAAVRPAPHVELPEWLLEETDIRWPTATTPPALLSGAQGHTEHRPLRPTSAHGWWVGEALSWSADEDGRVTLMSRNKIEPGQQVEFLLPGERPLVFTVAGNRPARCRWRASATINNPAHVFSMPCPHQVPINAAIRSRTKSPPSKPNNLPPAPLTGVVVKIMRTPPAPKKECLMPEYSEEILDSNSISSTDKAGRPIPVTIPIALAPGIKVVYTTRLGGLSTGDYGNLNLGGKSGDEPEAVLSNRIALAEAGASPPIAGPPKYIPAWLWTWTTRSSSTPPSASTCPAHMVRLTLRTSSRRTARSPAQSGIALGMFAADCLPVLLGDPVTGIIGAAHCGRRGLERGVIGATVDLMKSKRVPTRRTSSPHLARASAATAMKWATRPLTSSSSASR